MGDVPDTNTESKEALEYWGFLFQRNKCASDKLDRLLKGIARCIVCKSVLHLMHKY